MLHPSARACTLLATVLLASASVARADSTASLVVTPGSSLDATMAITVTTALGTSSDTDTKNIAAVGDAQLVLTPTDPAWTGVRFESIQLALADVTFNYQLYCFPIIGCQNLDVTLTAVYLEAAGPMEAAINPKTGVATFTDVPFRIFGAFSTTGVAEGAGPIATEVPVSFSCRVSATKPHDVLLDQLSLSPIANSFDPATLPSGVTALSFVFSTDLGGVTLAGPWAGDFPFDLDGNGAVDAADLASLLAQWGGGGTADFDGSGVVDAADLASLLGSWGPVP
ncbi:MAG: hypothetical protein RIS86_806 [Planctomycetota bacterium]|jgi:hypothetical protein